MKRKIALGLCASLVTLSLVGCSSTPKEEEKAPETSAPAVEETTAFTGEKTVETLYAEDSKDMVVTTVTFEEGKPVDVKIDVKLEDGGTKREAVEAGNYVMKDQSATWNEQIDTLQKLIVENDFDLSKITLSDEDGHTDAVSGVTIKIPAYLKGVEEALAQVK